MRTVGVQNDPSLASPALGLVLLTLIWAITPVAAQPSYVLEDDTWRKKVELDPKTPEGQLQTMRRQIAQEQAKSAQDLATEWIENYPNHPELAEAYLLRGDAYVTRRLYFKALFDYEYVLRVFPESPQFQTVLEREYDIARLFAAGLKRRWLGIFRLSAVDEAEELFIRIQERSPGSELAEKASIDLGHLYFRKSDMSSAVVAYELFLENYPTSRFRQRALLRLIQANLATFKGPNFDATGLIEASHRLKMFEAEFPVALERIGAQALRVRIQESLALKHFYQARWYERISQPVSAQYVYSRVVENYPQTVAAQAALRRLMSLTNPVDRQAPSVVPKGPKSDPAAEDTK